MGNVNYRNCVLGNQETNTAGLWQAGMNGGTQLGMKQIVSALSNGTAIFESLTETDYFTAYNNYFEVTAEGLNLPEDVTTYLIGGLTTLGTIFAGWAGLEFPKTAEARKEAVKKLKADAKLAKQQEKENAEYIAKAQAQLQASQDAQIKALAEQLKQKENETKNVGENITSL